MPGERGGFARDALHHAAVAGDDVDFVVGEPGLVEPGLRGEMALRDGHADRRGEPGAERSGRDVDAGGVAELGVSRRFALPLAEVFEFIHRKAVFEEMQQRVFEH